MKVLFGLMYTLKCYLKYTGICWVGIDTIGNGGEIARETAIGRLGTPYPKQWQSERKGNASNTTHSPSTTK